MSSISDVRLAAGRGGAPTKRDEELLAKFTKNGEDETLQAPELFADQMVCFLFEVVIRPMDNALVVHLKHLPPALRNGKFFEFATIFIRDRVGKFETLRSSFIGVVDSANKLNSLDIIFTKYYPALRGDMEFIKTHVAKVGAELDQLMVRELGGLVAAKT